MNSSSYPNIELQLLQTKALMCLLEDKYKVIDIQEIKSLIDEKVDVNYKNESRDIPLHLACANKNINIDIIKYLVSEKADILGKDDYYRKTALHYACENENNNIDIIKYLLSEKADINAKNGSRITPLNSICQIYQKESTDKNATAKIIAMLRFHGAVTNQPEKNKTVKTLAELQLSTNEQVLNSCHFENFKLFPNQIKTRFTTFLTCNKVLYNQATEDKKSIYKIPKLIKDQLLKFYFLSEYTSAKREPSEFPTNNLI